MKTFYIILITLIGLHISPGDCQAQIFTDSNLPIVIITTDNAKPIVDDPRVPGTMKIIYRGEGQRNYLTDQNNTAWLNYNGRIDIETRGSSSQTKPKKQYGFTTRMADNISNNNVSLLGMPEENDWILNSMAFDPALIRDYICYNLSRQIGEYASRTAYCELLINGIYKGLYLLQEKIKADEARVDVVKIEPGDNNIPDLTGGYITKADKTTGGDPVAWTMPAWTGGSINYIHELPKPEDVTYLQNAYIKGQFEMLASTVVANDASPEYGFPSVIDVPSFINYIIISEISSNADAYQFSTFFHKDRNGKLRAGPVWDNDLTFGNDIFSWGYDRSKTDVWQFANGNNSGSKFWKGLFDQGQFRCYLARRWNELTGTGQPLNLISLETFIDQTVALISEAVEREDALWGFTGNHLVRINAVKEWLAARITWMSANLGPSTGCDNITLPKLVITKIMYNPEETPEFPDGDDLEFIEITNTESQSTFLTGVYFAGTGLVYQFPPGFRLDGLSSVFLAGNIAQFRNKYGFLPSGKFTRSLSNNSEELLLCDALGNIIDKVVYDDEYPWPDADGNGNYLLLTDPVSDNNVAENWTISNDNTLDISDQLYTGLKLYPNPVADYLILESESEILKIRFYNMNGMVLSSEEVNSTLYSFDMRSFSAGFYIISITSTYGTFFYKIIKM
jgi:hypothetical protein